MRNRQDPRRSQIAARGQDSLFKGDGGLFDLIAPKPVETDFEELEDGSLLEKSHRDIAAGPR